MAIRQSARDPWWLAGCAFCGLMLGLHAIAGMNSQGLADFWRDIYWATAIAHGEALPLAGPQIYQMVELGPWWFYLLALPIRLTGSLALTMAFIQVLAALKYVLAWRIGIRIADPRLGLAFAVSLAIAGWSLAGLIFPSHTALVETTLLLLVLATWRCSGALGAGNAIVFGLACAACLHAHPTTLTYVLASGLFLLWRHRSRAAFGWLCLAAGIVLLSLLPPWLDRDPAVAAALKPIASYVDQDIGVQPLSRIPDVVRSIVVGGAWWGLLLMTPWKAAIAQAAWWVFCAGLLFAACGVVLLRDDARRLRTLCALALAAFLLQVAFVVLLRPVTPVWMIPTCLPPLALALATGWYGWLGSGRGTFRLAGGIALLVHAVLVLAPFSLLLRDIHALRVMPGVNPFFKAGDQADRYIKVAVPFYPLRRIDRLSGALCAPLVLHGRLAAVIEPTFGSAQRNACGHWPEFRYGGIEGPGRNIAGLFAPAATASGIAPQRVIAHMAIYDDVRPIAPASGGRSAPLRRLQINPDSGTGPVAKTVFEFDASGADAVVLTNRLPMAAPMSIDKVAADGRAAALLYDDGGSLVYRCAACAPQTPVHWRIQLRGIEANLDLVVLPHPGAASK